MMYLLIRLKPCGRMCEHASEATCPTGASGSASHGLDADPLAPS
jgi:hypothetical protein